MLQNDDDVRGADGDNPWSKGAVVARCSPALSGAQRRYLRGLGHGLNPVVLVGDRGAHPGVVRQVDQALLDHELIKVKVHGGNPELRGTIAEALFAEVGGQTVQVIGNVLLVFRPHPEEPKIVLPRGARRK